MPTKTTEKYAVARLSPTLTLTLTHTLTFSPQGQCMLEACHRLYLHLPESGVDGSSRSPFKARTDRQTDRRHIPD